MDTIFPACNTLEDDRFESIAEFKDCIGRGDEIEFEWKGVHFGMSGCQPKPEHRIMAYLWNQPESPVSPDLMRSGTDAPSGSVHLLTPEVPLPHLCGVQRNPNVQSFRLATASHHHIHPQ